MYAICLNIIHRIMISQRESGVPNPIPKIPEIRLQAKLQTPKNPEKAMPVKEKNDSNNVKNPKPKITAMMAFWTYLRIRLLSFDACYMSFL